MSRIQLLLTIGIATLATCLCRFLPFTLFRDGKKIPGFFSYLGDMLPRAAMAMLLVYCLKDLSFKGPLSGYVPALAGVAVTALLHLWRKNMLLSILTGTVVYMVLIRI